MPARVVRLAHEALVADGERLGQGIAAIQQELGVTAGFPAEVERAAAAAAENPRLPASDRTDLPFVTIDPATSMDLDQALHLERRGKGYVVHYAIADVAAFVSPEDALDLEAWRRGETLYGADSKIPLHPKVLSEGAASLLPDQARPALLWSIDVDEEGEGVAARVERALVRSRAKLDYAGVQQQLDTGAAPEVFGLLAEVGKLRLAREAARGGVSLPLPEQEIHVDGGHWSLDYRTLYPVEEWNAQISLLTGMAAAWLMMTAGIGILRTLPPADPRDIARLRRTAKALGVPWPDELSYPEFIRSVDPRTAAGAAVIVAATRTLRGSGYVAFDGEPPTEPRHSALAGEYAHVTAPLRRLVDRYAGEVCVAVSAAQPVPSWVVDQLPKVPDVMRESSRRAAQYERSITDLVEAAVLEHHVGEVFDGVVVSVDERDARQGSVVVQSPAIEARVTGSGDLPLGEAVKVRLAEADVVARKVHFELDRQPG